MMNYPWPGNVRELRTAVESAVVLSRGERISLRDLPAAIRETGPTSLAARVAPQGDLTVAEAEKRLIVRALKECDGNRTLAAKKLGMSRRTLHRKLHLYHLEGN
jgi:DNA-binding NtrC family response regulator